VLRVEERWCPPTARYDREGDPVLVFLTTADTEILAATHAVPLLPEGFGRVRCT
jgi:hypothetical protein